MPPISTPALLQGCHHIAPLPAILCCCATSAEQGKTFQAVSVLWTLLTTGTAGCPTCSKPLILCPSSLVSNWALELQRWLGDRVQVGQQCCGLDTWDTHVMQYGSL